MPDLCVLRDRRSTIAPVMMWGWPLAALVLASVAGAAAQPPTADDLLRAAFVAGDGDGVERAGRKAGARQLSLGLTSGDRILALASADAAPAADDAVWLL